MYIEDERKLDFNDILIKPKRSTLSSRKDVDLSRKFTTRHNNIIEGVPIIAANMSTGNFHMADQLSQHKMFTAIAKHNNWRWTNYFKEPTYDTLQKLYSQYCFYTIGMCDEELDELNNFRTLLLNSSNWIYKEIKICVDIANGYSQKFADFIRKVRETFPDNVIMAGNVCTPEMTQELIIAGADIIKIGIGPGSACTTRKMTGVGYPQVSACIENADVAHGLEALICLDGGMSCPGDIAKAFCANADFVMLGGIFAGTDQCEGDIITKYEHDGTYEKIRLPGNEEHFGFKENIVEKKYKIWYGMSSDKAQREHFNGVKEYRASEGLIEEIPYKGSVEIQVRNILGGLRSTGTYIGANTIKNFGKCGSFIKVNKIHSRF